MSAILIAGRARNHLVRSQALGQVSASIPPAASDESAIYPIAGLCDGDTKPFQFGTLAADRPIWVDVNALADPSFEDEGGDDLVPSAWTVKTGALVTDDDGPTPIHGTYAGKLSGTGAVTYQVLYRPAGEAFSFDWSAYGNADGGKCNVQIINLETGRYLKTDSTWSDSEEWLLKDWNTVDWTTGSVDAVLESMTLCGTDLARIMVRLSHSGGSGDIWFDALCYRPHTDFVAIFGHNVPPHVEVKLYSSTTGAFGGEETLRSTVTYEPRNMWEALGSLIKDRYWMLKFADEIDLDLLVEPDEAFVAIGITEGFLGQKTTLREAQQWDYGQNFTADQGRSTIGGLTRIYQRNPAPVEGFSLNWENTSAAGYEELRDLVFYASQLGAVKSVFVPDDTRRDIAYGCFGPDAASARNFLTVWGTPLRIESMPAAIFVQ